MTNAETMPQLRQYLRERGWQGDGNRHRRKDKTVLILKWRAHVHLAPLRYSDLTPDFEGEEQAAIDWLEANYPKEETK